MNKFLNIIDRIILILASIIFIILVGCISILPIAKSKSYYLKEQDKNNVEEILEKYTFNGDSHQHYDETTNSYYDCYWPKYDVTKDDLIKATNHIINYLYHSDVDSMQFQVLTSEGPVNFFSEQAIIHMQDVKVLFIGGIKLCYICLILFIVFVVYLVIRRKNILPIFFKTYLITVSIFIILGILVAIFAIVDFDLAFEIFHKIIFPDSDKVELALSFHYCDTLTNVLTGDFFMHIGLIIGITFISILVCSLIICGLLKKYGSNLKSILFKSHYKNKKHLNSIF